jgi:hypothetical protein
MSCTNRADRTRGGFHAPQNPVRAREFHSTPEAHPLWFAMFGWSCLASFPYAPCNSNPDLVIYNVQFALTCVPIGQSWRFISETLPDGYADREIVGDAIRQT